METPVDQVEQPGDEHSFQRGFLAALSRSEFEVVRDALEEIELIGFDTALSVAPQGPEHARQGVEECSVLNDDTQALWNILWAQHGVVGLDERGEMLEKTGQYFWLKDQ